MLGRLIRKCSEVPHFSNFKKKNFRSQTLNLCSGWRLSLISWYVICFHVEVGKRKAWARNQETRSAGPSAAHPRSSLLPQAARARQGRARTAGGARTAETRKGCWRRVRTRVGCGGRRRPHPLEGLARRASVFRCGVRLLRGRRAARRPSGGAGLPRSGTQGPMRLTPRRSRPSRASPQGRPGLRLHGG